MQSSVASEPDPQPEPTAVLAIVRTGAQALCVTLGRRKGEKFLREWARIAASEESIRTLFPTRPAHEREAQAVAQRQAVAWLRSALPVLFGSLPPQE